MNNDEQFKSLVLEQLLTIREEIGSLKGRAAVWGLISGGGISIVAALISHLLKKA